MSFDLLCLPLVEGVEGLRPQFLIQHTEVTSSNTFWGHLAEMNEAVTAALNAYVNASLS